MKVVTESELPAETLRAAVPVYSNELIELAPAAEDKVPVTSTCEPVSEKPFELLNVRLLTSWTPTTSTLTGPETALPSSNVTLEVAVAGGAEPTQLLLSADEKDQLPVPPAVQVALLGGTITGLITAMSSTYRGAVRTQFVAAEPVAVPP